MLNLPLFYSNQADSPNNSLAHELKTLWQDTLDDLSRVMTRATFTSLLNGSKPISLADDTLTVWVSSTQSADWLNYRLKNTVSRSLSSMAGTPMRVEFTATRDFSHQRTVTVPSAPRIATRAIPSDALSHEIGAPHACDSAEVNSRYFSAHWRPLLGPLLSELVRELRYLAHALEPDSAEYALVQVSQGELAQRLGVSRSTIARAISRSPDNTFPNKYLHHFLPEVTFVQVRDEKGNLRNESTQFTVRLSEPLVPER